MLGSPLVGCDLTALYIKYDNESYAAKHTSSKKRNISGAQSSQNFYPTLGRQFLIGLHPEIGQFWKTSLFLSFLFAPNFAVTLCCFKASIQTTFTLRVSAVGNKMRIPANGHYHFAKINGCFFAKLDLWNN